MEMKKFLKNVTVYVATLRFSGRFGPKCQKSHRFDLLKCCELSFSPIFKMLVSKFPEIYVVFKKIYKKILGL